jgi:hypothetical protein
MISEKLLPSMCNSKDLGKKENKEKRKKKTKAHHAYVVSWI